jgi:hypothetical protein
MRKEIEQLKKVVRNLLNENAQLKRQPHRTPLPADDTRTLPTVQVPPTVLPQSAGSASQQLDALIQFAQSNWPDKNFGQFRAGTKVQGWVLEELLRLDLLPRHILLSSPHKNVAKSQPKYERVVVYTCVNHENQLADADQDHYVVMALSLTEKCFTSWGVSPAKLAQLKTECGLEEEQLLVVEKEVGTGHLWQCLG